MSSVSLKLRVMPRFLASIFSGLGTTMRIDGLARYFDLDYSQLAPAISFDPSVQNIAVQSSVDGSWQKVSIAQILTSSLTEQDISAGATVNVSTTDGVIKINKTVGSATTVNLPAASSKIGPVKVVDWKGDAGTNNITINCVGTDKFNGNLASWVIAADGGSLVFTPLKDGTGYAI